MAKIHQSKYITTVFIICQLVLALLPLITDLIINTDQSDIEEFESMKEKIILVLFVAPIFETLILNLILNEVIFKYLGNTVFCILFSSVIFGLVHYYSLTYIFFTFLTGLVFNMFYFYIRKIKGYKFAVLGVFLLHFNHNLIGLLLGK